MSLNDAPRRISELENLPVKRVNGTMVYMRDVAHVRDGSPPQNNIVHVDGSHAVLMTILKAGAASTLDIIAKTKALLPQIQSTLPPSLQSYGGRRPIGLCDIGRHGRGARGR